MIRLKKIAIITLFLSLIASFVLYRADVFKYVPKKNSQLIVENFITKKDSIERHRRLIINYVFHLEIDTTRLSVKKSVVKTFTLESFADKVISGSKSAVLYEELPRYKTKDKDIRNKLWSFNIERVRFTTNKVFEGISNDYDLKEVIELVEKNTLKSHTSVEQYISEQKMVDLYWKRFKDYRVEVNLVNNERGVLVKREKVDEFLEHSDLFKKIKVKNRSEIMSSSKSIQLVIDSEEIENPSPKYLLFRDSFRVLVEDLLDIKF